MGVLQPNLKSKVRLVQIFNTSKLEAAALEFHAVFVPSSPSP